VFDDFYIAHDINPYNYAFSVAVFTAKKRHRITCGYIVYFL
jgi:hypothetical protein